MNLRELAEQFCECPCCTESVECLPGCTYHDDAPIGAETMRAAREALRLEEIRRIENEAFGIDTQSPAPTRRERHICERHSAPPTFGDDSCVWCQMELLHSEIDRLHAEQRTSAKLREELAAARAEVARLREIVDRLPKTADGVPIVPGMKLWPYFEIEDEEGAVAGLHVVDTASGEVLIDGDELDSATLYSTRKAAEIARKAAT